MTGSVPPLLAVDDLRVAFRAGRTETAAVRSLSYELHPGEVLAIVGESGSGKSVGAAALLGLLPRNAVVAGSAVFEGRQLVGATESSLAAVRGTGISAVFQNPATGLDPSFTVGTQLVEVIRHHRGESRRQARATAAHWLDLVGIGDAGRVLAGYPHELSGGMRQRVLIALAMVPGPRLLLADEPTTALDATVQKQVLDLLLRLNAELGVGIVLITHDFGVVTYASDRVLVMRDGVLVEQGRTSDVVARPQDAYTRTLLGSVSWSAPPPGAVAPAGSPRLRARFAARRPDDGRDAVPVLSARAASKRYKLVDGPLLGGGTWFTALTDASADLYAGETLGLIGESGSGKSTLARLLSGLEPPSAGDVVLDGEPTTGRSASEWRAFHQSVQLVFQDNSVALNPAVPVGEQLARPVRRLTSERSVRELVTDLLQVVGIDPALAHRYPHQLSGGQRQRVGIARALSVGPRVVILDEPTSALDVTTRGEILDLLAGLRDEFGLGYLLIGHDLGLVRDFCDRIAVMDGGRIVETFPAAELSSPDRSATTRALLDAELTRPARADPNRTEARL